MNELKKNLVINNSIICYMGGLQVNIVIIYLELQSICTRDRSVEYDDNDIIESNEDIINIHDFLCQCKHKRLTLSPDEHIGI